MADSARLLNPIPVPTPFSSRRSQSRRLSLSFPIVRCSSSSSSHTSSPSLNPNPNPNPNPNQNLPPLSCYAVSPPSSVSFPSAADADVSTVRHRLRCLVSEFRSLPSPIDRVKRLLHYVATLPPFRDADRIPANRVMGCTAQVWISVSLDQAGALRFAAESDSEITRGFCACVVAVLDGAALEEVLEVRPEDFRELSVVVPPGGKGAQSRATWQNVVVSMQKRARILVAREEGRPVGAMFPSMVVGVEGVEAKGSYAEAQVSSKFGKLIHISDVLDE